MRGPGAHLSDSVRVYVSDENTVTVPDEFENSGVVEGIARNDNALLKVQTPMEDGVYAIVSGGKVLYSAKNLNRVDQLAVTDQGGELNPNYDKPSFTMDTQTWKVTGTEQGYTLESMAWPGHSLAVQAPAATTGAGIRNPHPLCHHWQRGGRLSDQHRAGWRHLLSGSERPVPRL